MNLEIINSLEDIITKHVEHIEGDFEFRKNKNTITIKLCNIAILRVYPSKVTQIEVSMRYFELFCLEESSIIKEGKGWCIINFDDKNRMLILKNIKSVFEKCIDDSTKETFGCCNSFIECSDAKKCIHPDRKFARGCMYKENLEKDMIFYGKNKNFPEYC